MFGQKHYHKELSAYAHGELPGDETRRVAEHLDACAKCRREFEEIRLGIRLAEALPQRAAPAAMWDAIEAALPKPSARNKEASGSSHAREATVRLTERLLHAFNWRRVAFASIVLLFTLGSGATWLYVRGTRSTWEVARLQGTPRIDSDAFGASGQLAVGEWLETDAASRAKIRVADIGQVEIDPDTRIRLVTTRFTEHRLELARGKMHATIWAPPRIFFVNTPSAVAADLGCAYTLEVDDKGRSLLHVTSGKVALETPTHESLVPAGAACVTAQGHRPGTPFFEDAPDEMIVALARFDFENGGHDALETVLDTARPRDTLTLWHLLPRVDDEDARARVYERLAAFDAPPDGVTRAGVLNLDPEMLELWQEHLETTWLQESLPAVRKAWRRLWK